MGLIDKALPFFSFLAYPVVDSSIARRQPWALWPPPARRRSRNKFFFSSPLSQTLVCKEIHIPCVKELLQFRPLILTGETLMKGIKANGKSFVAWRKKRQASCTPSFVVVFSFLLFKPNHANPLLIETTRHQKFLKWQPTKKYKCISYFLVVFKFSSWLFLSI